MESDIVDRLRGGATKDYGCQCPKCEAADEIESLRAELAVAIKQRDEARQLYRALLEVIKEAAGPREKEGGGA